VPFARRTKGGRSGGSTDAVYSFPSSRQARGPRMIGAVIALVAFLGSLVAVTVGPALGEMLPPSLLLWLMLIRG
jgi:hypothetical protein